MVRKITKTSSRLALAFVVCILSTGCGLVSDDSGIFQPSDQRLLSKLERKHDKLRAKTKQELANSLETLIDAHPNLVFGYQRMTTSDDPVVANIARYRLAQVHLELGCALEEVAQQSKQQAESSSGLEPIAWDHLERAHTNFSQASATSLQVNPDQTSKWHEAYSALGEHATAYENGAPPPFEREVCPPHYKCCDMGLSREKSPLAPEPVKRTLRHQTHDSALICKTLQTEYLGPLKAFIY